MADCEQYTRGTKVIAKETATVYRSGRRRFLTKRAAIHHFAMQRIKAKHPCECEDGEGAGYPGYNCHVHEHWQKLAPRYERVLRAALKVVSA